MENKETLGKRIAMLRKEKGLTQEQLAEKVGVSAQAVSKWENDVSCPDITLLPLLADILGVSVDELLGTKPIEPHVIILDKDEVPKEDPKKSRSFSWEWNKHRESVKWGTVAFCIGAILVCLMFVIRSFPQLGLFQDVPEEGLKAWGYAWPLILFAIGLISVKDHIPFGVAMMAFGGYEFVRRTLIPYGVKLLPIPWYVILLIIAIITLVLVLVGKKHLIVRVNNKGDKKDREPSLDVSEENGYLDADMSFGSGVITFDGETMNGGSIDMNFGDYKVDLRNVKTFSENCLLQVDQNFGSLTVFLPGNVRLVKSSDTSFGSFTTLGGPDPDANQTSIIRADVNFGTLQVKSE